MSLLEYYLSAIVLNMFGLLFRLWPINTNKVVFASARQEQTSGNLAEVYRAYKTVYPDYRYILLLRRYSYGLIGKISYLVYLIRTTYHLITCRTMYLDNAFFPVHVVQHRRETRIVQLWHATGALKKFGLDITISERRVENRFLHKYYDYVIADSKKTQLVYSRAFNIPLAQVLPLGSPRTDALLNEETLASWRTKIYRNYPELIGKNVILYAPTFRGFGSGKYLPDYFDAQRLSNFLGPEYALVFKPHSVVHDAKVSLPGFTVVASPDDDINELFSVTDILITDYSSALFEFALLKKPIYKLCPDLHEYTQSVGLYVDYEKDLVGRIVQSVDDIGQDIKQTGSALTSKELHEYDVFLREFCTYSDGQATPRLLQYMESSNNTLE